MTGHYASFTALENSHRSDLLLEDGLLGGDPLLLFLPHPVEQAPPLLHQLVRLLQLVGESGALHHDVLHLPVARQAAPRRHVAVEVRHLLPDAVELAVEILKWFELAFGSRFLKSFFIARAWVWEWGYSGKFWFIFSLNSSALNHSATAPQ